MIGYLVLAFLVYFLYRLIVGFILPVVRTANQMKRKVNEMNGSFGRQNTSQQKTASEQVNVTGEKKGPFSRFTRQKAAGQAVKPSKSDYIDFEELK